MGSSKLITPAKKSYCVYSQKRSSGANIIMDKVIHRVAEKYLVVVVGVDIFQHIIGAFGNIENCYIAIMHHQKRQERAYCFVSQNQQRFLVRRYNRNISSLTQSAQQNLTGLPQFG